jgi:Zn-dependent protease with chaperone function
MFVRLFVSLAARFGRYTALAFTALGLLLFLSSLSLLDTSPLIALATMLATAPAAMIGIAMFIGVIFANHTSPKSADDPKQFNLIREEWVRTAGKLIADKTDIVLLSEINAFAAEQRTGLLSFGRRYTLGVGLPLMAAIDLSAFRSVLGHEFAHMRFKDTDGALNLHEFEMVFQTVFQYANPNSTVMGAALWGTLEPLSRSIGKEEIWRSKQAELRADSFSAKTGNSELSTRALLLIGAASEFVTERVFEPLEKELLGAMIAPSPPLSRILAVLPQLREAKVLNKYTEIALLREEEPDATHPSISQRLAALSTIDDFKVEPISGACALDILLDSSFVIEKVAQFDREWTYLANESLER